MRLSDIGDQVTIDGRTIRGALIEASAAELRKLAPLLGEIVQIQRAIDYSVSDREAEIRRRLGLCVICGRYMGARQNADAILRGAHALCLSRPEVRA